MNRPTMAYSQHQFRANTDDVSEFPLLAPSGQSFYLVTPTPHAPVAKRRYFVAAPRNKADVPRIMVAHDKSQAMEFSNLRLAESFATFVNNPLIFPNGEEFWIALETAKYGQEPVARSRFTVLADAITKY